MTKWWAGVWPGLLVLAMLATTPLWLATLGWLVWHYGGMAILLSPLLIFFAWYILRVKEAE